MLKVSATKKISKKDEFIVFPVFDEYKKTTPFGTNINKLINDLVKSKDFKFEEGARFYNVSDDKSLPKRIFLIGLGKKKEFTSEKAREFGATALSEAQSKKQTSLTIYAYGIKELNDNFQALTEGLALTNYTISQHKTGKEKKKIEESFVKSVSIVTSSKTAAQSIKKALSLSYGVFKTRDLVNAPANILTPSAFEKEAKLIAKEIGAKFTVINKKQLQKLGAGLILAVNAGSANGDHAARMVVLDYNPTRSKKVDAAIVGKGLIFDSGGLNLKPTRHIETMHQDMGGAATMLGLMSTLKKLGIKKHVVGVAPITENAIDGLSFRPSDILTSYSGKTVEIGNTDAEGRLILADALNYTATKYKPEYMIDLATLTGACVVALGEEYAGIMGNDKGIIDALKKASKNTDEEVWELPIHKKHEESMKSDIADLRNDSKNSYHAGASTAGAFLKQFVEKINWVHIDIAGTAYVSRPKKYEKKNASGYGVRLLADFVENL